MRKAKANQPRKFGHDCRWYVEPFGDPSNEIIGRFFGCWEDGCTTVRCADGKDHLVYVCTDYDQVIKLLASQQGLSQLIFDVWRQKAAGPIERCKNGHPVVRQSSVEILRRLGMQTKRGQPLLFRASELVGRVAARVKRRKKHVASI